MLDRIGPWNRLFSGGRRYRIGMRLGLASTLSGAKELRASVRSGRSERRMSPVLLVKLESREGAGDRSRGGLCFMVYDGV
jgi:hypothetical protein